MSTPSPIVPDPVLRDILNRSGGSMPFEEFMREALYHPEHGYYSSRVARIGRRGDFSTAATLHTGLGEAIASWALRRREEQLPRGKWNLIEAGGGSGDLAESILRALPWSARRRLRYRMVELSPGLGARQVERLGRWRVEWHRSMADALEASVNAALVISNELVDAFPCKRIVRRGGAWREIHVVLEGDSVVEGAGPITDRRVESDLCSIPRLLREPEEGQRCEVHLAYHDWLAGWSTGLRRGSLLTIDYGDEAARLYEGRREGTLRGYFQHLPMDGDRIYRRFGRQDLTADVNFTDLAHWGQRCGFRTLGLGTQREFLIAHAPSLVDRAETDPALSYLLHPAGPGSAFKVLEQKKNGDRSVPVLSRPAFRPPS